jgi:AAHS family 4-hydroxybenzoate transporter-like MFS transporter
VLFGSQIFGWIGDRYGRKTALILANFLFGVLTFAAAYSTNLTELSAALLGRSRHRRSYSQCGSH